MINKPWNFLILLLLIPALLHAQPQGRALIDSLLKAILATSDDTQKVKMLIDISKSLQNINPDTGIIYGNNALELAEKIHYRLGVGRAISAIGNNYEAKTDNPSALNRYNKALAIFLELKDSLRVAITNGNIGNIYQFLGEYDKALMYDTKALEYYEAHEDYEGLARILGNIGVVYDIKKDYSKALFYYDSAIKIDEILGKVADIAKNQGNIAGIYSIRKDFVKALSLANKALKIYLELDDKRDIAINYCNIGSFYVQMAEHLGKTRGFSQSDSLTKAISFLESGISISRDIGYLDGVKDGYDGLRDAYLLLGAYDKAEIIKDSITSTINKIKVANVEAALQIAQQKDNLIKLKLEADALQLRDENNKKTKIIYIIGISLLILAVVVIGRYAVSELKSNRKLAMERKKHIERIREQKTVLKDIAYVQSHEVRGPVSTILGLTQLFNYDDPADPTNLELMEGVSTVAKRLDKIVTEVVNKENNLNNAADIESDKEDNI